LLIGILGRHRGDHYVEIAKAAGARGGTVAPARSVCGGRILQALALGDVLQDVVFTLLGAEADEVIAAVRQAAEREPKKMAGLAIVLDVTGMRLRLPGAVAPAQPGPEEAGAAETQARPKENNAGAVQAQEEDNARSKQMDADHKLITVIVNSGYADEIMAKAREAGATGGTILAAHGTGTQEDVKFFGITLVPEKEILMIVTDKARHAKILAAIDTVPVLSEPGGGIVYCQNVDEFYPIGAANH
jgi:nitrogen regulatory protein PII